MRQGDTVPLTRPGKRGQAGVSPGGAEPPQVFLFLSAADGRTQVLLFTSQSVTTRAAKSKRCWWWHAHTAGSGFESPQHCFLRALSPLPCPSQAATGERGRQCPGTAPSADPQPRVTPAHLWTLNFWFWSVHTSGILITVHSSIDGAGWE